MKEGERVVGKSGQKGQLYGERQNWAFHDEANKVHTDIDLQ